MDECMRCKYCSATRREIRGHALCLHPKTPYLHITSVNNVHCDYYEVIGGGKWTRIKKRRIG